MKDRANTFSELTFQAIVESTPNAIVLVNKEGKIAYVNSQTEQLFQYQKAELIGQFVEILIPERFKAKHPGFRNMFFKAPSVREMGAGRELFAVKKDKSEFPIEIGLNPVITVDGTLVLASIIDITERKKAEEQFRLVVESAPNAMVLINSSGKITLVNTQAEKLFGYKRDEIIGEKLEILIPQRFKKNHPKHRNTFFKDPSVRAMGAGRELYALKKDKTEIQVEIGLNPIDSADGPLVLASIIDISQRKLQEKIIKQQLHELETKNVELEQFAYIASHDLQEPLGTIANYTHILKEDFENELGAAGISHLQSINRATNKARTLVRSLLNFSRLGKNRKLEKVDINQILEQHVQNLNNGNNVTITWPQNTLVINGFKSELIQLFQHLIENAVTFRKKTTPPKVTIDWIEKPTEWEFIVSDNGIGIDEKNFQRIFDIFQQINLTDKKEGYGIGLANCKKIVELHNGTIWVESVLNQGSKFHFTLYKFN